MKAKSILDAKGNTVVTTGPETMISAAIKEMAQAKIGALVVKGGGEEIIGIITERDILHGLAEHEAALLEMQVGDLMSQTVLTASLEDDVGTLMAMMTEHRCRHIPVHEEGALCGLISIGDLVKVRHEEIEREASQLRDYIAGS